MEYSKTIIISVALILLILSSFVSVLAVEKTSQVVEVRFIEQEDICKSLALFCYIKRLIKPEPKYTTVTEVTEIEDEPISKIEIIEDSAIKYAEINKIKEEELQATKLNLKSFNLKKFDPKLIEKLERGEDVRVWVRTDPAKETTLSKSTNMLRNHPGLKQKYRIGYAGKLSLDNLKDIQDNPDVIEVIEDGVFYLSTEISIPIINADDVHGIQVNGEYIDGSGQNICIIDSGIDYTHPELQSRVINGPDSINDDNDSMDTQGHGTLVAGIAARTAPGSKLIAVRACDDSATCYWSDIASSVFWCNNNRNTYNITIISMSIQDYNSWNESNCPTTLEPYFRLAYNNKMSIEVCSGNQGSTTGIGYPSCSPYVTSVGSSQKSDTAVRPASNRGPNLDILAPGESINSTYLGGTYSARSGTSFATPFVSGVAALVRQFASLHNYTLTTQEVEDLLKSTGKIIAQWPRVDALAAIQKLNETITACQDTDNDMVCDTEDLCIGENQANLPASTTCTTYSFNSSTGCHTASYASISTVCGNRACPADSCVGVYWYDYTSPVNRYCDGAGTCSAAVCNPYINYDIDCDHDMSVEEFYLNNTEPIRVGDLVRAIITLKNNGAHTERLINYTISTGETGTWYSPLPYAKGTIIAYPPATARTGSIGWIYEEAGDFNVTLTMDPENALAEADETNNQMSFMVHVSPN